MSIEKIKMDKQNLELIKKFPDFKSGDIINVYIKIREGNKETIQQFQGTVIQSFFNGLGAAPGPGAARFRRIPEDFGESRRISEKSGEIRRIPEKSGGTWGTQDPSKTN